MDLNTVAPKYNPGICRCCLSEGGYKDLSTEYTWVNETEIYGDMLLECFDISISQHAEGPNGLNRYICEVCITRLRDACHFKQQVICSEKKFIDMVSRGEFSFKRPVYADLSFKQEDQTESERALAVEYLGEGADFLEDDAKPLKKDMSAIKETVAALMSAGDKSCKRRKRKIKNECKEKTLSKRNKLIKKEEGETSNTPQEGDETSEGLKRQETAHRLTVKRKNIEYVLLYSNVTPFLWLDGSYRCFYCTVTAKNWQQLKEHTSEKHIQENLELVIYDRTNLDKNKDVTVNIDVTDIECKLCFRPIDSFDSLLRHIIDEHDAEYDVNVANCFMPVIIRKNVWLECGICKEQFMHFESLLYHFNKCHVSRKRKAPCRPKVKKTKTVKTKLKESTNRDGLKRVRKSYCTKGELGKHMLNKQLHNLQTILNYSNAVPFKHKTLLGFVCDYCKKLFPDPLDLRHHNEQVHCNERQYKLTNIDIRTFTVNLDVTDLTCGICQLKVLDLKQLKEHLVETHEKSFHDGLKDHFLQFKLLKEDKYKCAFCPSLHETFKMLKQHMNVHYSNYMCNQCGTPFATWTSLKIHGQTHFKGSFKCTDCDKVFATRSKCKYHQKMIHTSKTKAGQKCPHCDEHFQNYYRRNQHMVLVHNSEVLYKCNVCGKGFFLKTYLMNHIKKSHLMEKNHRCTYCEMKFFDRKGLSDHMVKHITEKVHQCEVCSKSYKSKKTLGQHMRIHNDDRRFKY